MLIQNKDKYKEDIPYDKTQGLSATDHFDDDTRLNKDIPYLDGQLKGKDIESNETCKDIKNKDQEILTQSNSKALPVIVVN